MKKKHRKFKALPALEWPKEKRDKLSKLLEQQWDLAHEVGDPDAIRVVINTIREYLLMGLTLHDDLLNKWVDYFMEKLD